MISHPVAKMAALLLIGLAILLDAQAQPSPAPGAPFAPGEVLVKFSPGADARVKSASDRATVAQAAESFNPALARLLLDHDCLSLRPLVPATSGPTVKTGRPTLPAARLIYRLQFSSNAPIADLAQALAALPGVEWAEPNYLGGLAYAPNDPLFVEQAPDLGLIHIEAAWQEKLARTGTSGGAPGVLVAVIDSGVDPNHADLAAAINTAASFNVRDNNAIIFDDIGHGTRVAGQIAAVGNNAQGIAGVAFGATLISFDVADPAGEISAADVAAAVAMAADAGAAVVNMSLRFTAPSQALRSLCDEAFASGILLVAAAGNGNQGDAPVYPASLDSVLGVGAVLDDGSTRAPFSNFNGDQSNLVELVAPGATIYSTVPNSLYNGTYGSGTSFAAPIVSGVAALLKSLHPEQSGPALRHHLRQTAAPVPLFLPVGGAGFGLVDAEAAMKTPLLPDISVAAAAVNDDPGYSIGNNGDGTMDRGETLLLTLSLTTAAADYLDVTGILQSSDPDVTILTDTAEWPVISHGAPQSSPTAFEVTISPATLAHPVEFVLELSSAATTFTQQIVLTLNVENESNIPAGTSLFSSTRWTSDTTYVVEGQLNVFDDFEIEPGTTVRLKEAGQIEILGGNFSAVGAPAHPILFKPFKEESAPAGQMAGNLIWARQSTGNNTKFPGSLIAYPDGSFIVGGQMGIGQTTFGPGEANQTTLNSINGCLFICRYDADGRLVWAKQAGDSQYSSLRGLAQRPDGDFYATGSIWGSATFGAGEPGAKTLQSAGESDQYVARYASNGSLVWAVRGGGSLQDGASSVAVMPDGGCVVSGVFFGTATFVGSDNASQMLTANDALDIFLARYSETGILMWLRRAGGVENEDGLDLAVDGSGLIWMTGWFRQDAVFGPGETNQTTLVSSGFSDFFIARYENDGDLIWVRQAGGVGFESGNAIALRSDDTAIVTGHFDDVCTFGDGEANETVLTSRGDYDIFIARYMSNGDLAWARSAGGDNSDKGLDVALDAEDEIYVTGYLGKNTVLGGGETGEQTVNSSGDGDFFLARFAENGDFLYVRYAGSHSAEEEGCAVQVLSDGSALVAGKFQYSPIFGLGEPAQTRLTADDDNSELFIARFAGREHWRQVVVSASAASAIVQHVQFDGGGLLNEKADATIQHATFDHAILAGLRNTAAGVVVSDCVARYAGRGGLELGAIAVADSRGDYNRDNGIKTTGAISGSAATGNLKSGLVGVTVSNSAATGNLGTGIEAVGNVTECEARDNGGHGVLCAGGSVAQTIATGNAGAGIEVTGGGSISASMASRNGGNGITTQGALVQDCAVEGNGQTGVSGNGSTQVLRALIARNGGAAAANVQSVQESAIVNNQSGLVGAAAVTQSYVFLNGGPGVTGGAVSDSTVAANQSHGVLNAASVGNSWVVANKGVGVSGNNATSVQSSTISGNVVGGVQNLSAASLNGSNIFGNTGFAARDTQTRSGFQTKNFEGNYWGVDLTTWMLANPFPNDRDPEIEDGFDGPSGWFLDYSPPAATPVPSAPDTTPPAFVVGVTTVPDQPIGVGLTTFTLQFSEPMNTAINPSVTFDSVAPYTLHVIEPNPGWISATAWRGRFWIQSDTGDSLNTITISSATAADGFVIPNDQSHQFVIDTSGGAVVNNGLASALGSTKMKLTWTENDKPATALGYQVARENGPGIYDIISTSLVVQPEYIDEGLQPSTNYTYKVYIIYDTYESNEWVTAFGTTLATDPTPLPDGWVLR